jgi:hypothetical protein
MGSRLLILALLAVSSSASASETPADPSARSWYGLQTLVADGGALAGGIATSGTLFFPGYLLGAPIVHAIHGRPLRGFLDLGLRLGLPFAGAALLGGAKYLGSRESGPPLLAFSVLGAASGAITAVALDATVLAWDDAPARKERAFSISPTLRFFGKEKTFGLVGMW